MQRSTNELRARRYLAIFGLLLFSLIPGTRVFAPLHAGEIKETFDDGKLKIHFHTDEQNRKSGTYEEYYSNGQLKVRGQYTAGKKSGHWQLFDDGGKPSETISYRSDLIDGAYSWHFPGGKPGLRATYRMGQLAGPLTVLDDMGRVVRYINYPHTRQAVEKMFASLYYGEVPPVTFTTEPRFSAPYKAGVLSPRTLDAAVKLTQLYRYLSGVPWEDLKADPFLCKKSAHAAVLLARIGSLTHMPDRPADMDGDFFRLAYAGCHEANLDSGPNPVEAVRDFMNDSDASNVDRIGHRQWVLSPGLQRVGFGSADHFVSMHVWDGARDVKLDFDFVAYPGAGFYPRQLIEPQCAWSVHFNSRKVKLAPVDALKITLQKLDEHYQPMGEAAAAKVISCPAPMASSFGWRTIVFKPELAEIEAARYWVEISGIENAAGADAPFGYIVDFIDMPAAQAPAKS